MALTGELDLTAAITRVEPLEGVDEALGRLRRGEGARTVLIVDEELAGYV
jgi:Zn-dependent alcohol dehydrogenase